MNERARARIAGREAKRIRRYRCTAAVRGAPSWACVTGPLAKIGAARTAMMR